LKRREKREERREKREERREKREERREKREERREKREERREKNHRLVMKSVFSETILTILEISKSGGSCPHMSSWSSVMYSSCFLVVISECVGLFCFHVFIPKNPFLDMRYIILRTVIFGISVGK